MCRIKLWARYRFLLLIGFFRARTGSFGEVFNRIFVLFNLRLALFFKPSFEGGCKFGRKKVVNAFLKILTTNYHEQKKNHGVSWRASVISLIL